MESKKLWGFLPENKRFELSVEVGVPDLPYHMLSENEKEKISSYTNYGDQAGGNLTNLANGKGRVDNSYGDPDVDEMSGNEVSLEMMEKAKNWWNKREVGKKWSDMRIKERQKAINAYLRHLMSSEVDSLIDEMESEEAEFSHQKNHNIDKYLEIAEDDYERKEGRRNEEYEKTNYGYKPLGRGSKERFEPDEHGGDDKWDIDESLIKALEGGHGSGKNGHEPWMKGVVKGPDYGKCKNCGVATEIRNGKCNICGKSRLGESDLELILNEDAYDRAFDKMTDDQMEMYKQLPYENELSSGMNKTEYLEEISANEAVGLDAEWADNEPEDVKQAHKMMKSQKTYLDYNDDEDPEFGAVWQRGQEGDWDDMDEEEKKNELRDKGFNEYEDYNASQDEEDLHPMIRDEVNEREDNRCHICDSETHDTDSHYNNISEEEEIGDDYYDHIGEVSLKMRSAEAFKPLDDVSTKDIGDIYKKGEESKISFGSSSYEPYTGVKEEEVKKKSKKMGKEVDNVASRTLICDCGFYTTNKEEYDGHDC